MERIFRIFRYDSRSGKDPHYREYRVETGPSDKILDCINRIRWEQDPTLTYRMSCAHGVCGSDAVKINGVCALACQRLVRNYGGGQTILIEPLPHFPVIRDLLVDFSSFFEKYRSVFPYLMTKLPAPEGERLQSPRERMAFDEAVRCILCGCCTAACPILDANQRFLGPAALLRAFRYLFDSRDSEDRKRMAMLDSDDGVWGCQSHGRCTEVCPKDIAVTRSIGRIKKRIHDQERS